MTVVAGTRSEVPPDGSGTPHPAVAPATPWRWVVGVATVNLVVQIAIVVTGGVVRLTGSGLGCPTWPECTDGSLVPTADQVEGFARFVEFGNRLLTFVVGVAAVAVAFGVLRRRRDLWWLGLLPFVGTVGQAVLGGVTVLTGLHPATVSAHFLLSMALVAASTALLIRLREPRGPVTDRAPLPLRAAAWSLAGIGSVVLVLGTVVTGSGPHAGDAAEPVRFQLDPRTVSWLHADAVMVFTGLLAGYLVAVGVARAVGAPWAARGAWRDAWRWPLVLGGVVVLQAVVGYVQYFTGVPRPLVAAHMLLATLFTATLTAVVLSTRRRRPADAPPTRARVGA